MNDLTALGKQTIERAVAGDQKALEEVLARVQDLVFNLSLRMLGLLPDAEDATQELSLIHIFPGAFGKKGAAWRPHLFCVWGKGKEGMGTEGCG